METGIAATIEIACAAIAQTLLTSIEPAFKHFIPNRILTLIRRAGVRQLGGRAGGAFAEFAVFKRQGTFYKGSR